MILDRFLKKNPTAIIHIVVPSKYLHKQWSSKIRTYKSVSVFVVNTYIKEPRRCTLLVVDEVHRVGSEQFIKTLTDCSHDLFLGLTATLTRADGREKLITDIGGTVFDIVTLQEALSNGWISNHKVYQVMVPLCKRDQAKYDAINKKFYNHFSFFDDDFKFLMSMLGKNGKVNQMRFAEQLQIGTQEVASKAFAAIRAIKDRKTFVYNHYSKIAIANKILSRLKDHKAITFCQDKETTKRINNSISYHSGLSKPQRNKIEKSFNNNEFRIISSVSALDEGADIQGLSLAVMSAITSSDRAMIQRIGRVIRYEGKDKVAVVFVLTLKGTVEEQWMSRAKIRPTRIQLRDLDEILESLEDTGTWKESTDKLNLSSK